MLRTIISLFIFIGTTPATADFVINLDSFNQFKELTIKSAPHVPKDESLKSREDRQASNNYIYSSYRYSPDAPTHQWVSDGYTVLKDNPSNESERAKVKTIQQNLKEYFGDSYDEKMARLDDTYTLVDVRYYSVNTEENNNEACISVYWRSPNLNDTINYCGTHSVDNEGLTFEVNSWAINNNTAFTTLFFKDQHAWQLLEFATAALAIVYSDPANQRTLLDSLNHAQSN